MSGPRPVLVVMAGRPVYLHYFGPTLRGFCGISGTRRVVVLHGQRKTCLVKERLIGFTEKSQTRNFIASSDVALAYLGKALWQWEALCRAARRFEVALCHLCEGDWWRHTITDTNQGRTTETAWDSLPRQYKATEKGEGAKPC